MIGESLCTTDIGCTSHTTMFPHTTVFGHIGTNSSIIMVKHSAQQVLLMNRKNLEWELFDLENDPNEMCSVYDDPEYADVVKELTAELYRLKEEAMDDE